MVVGAGVVVGGAVVVGAGVVVGGAVVVGAGVVVGGAVVVGAGVVVIGNIVGSRVSFCIGASFWEIHPIVMTRNRSVNKIKILPFFMSLSSEIFNLFFI